MAWHVDVSRTGRRKERRRRQFMGSRSLGLIPRDGHGWGGVKHFFPFHSIPMEEGRLRV